MVNLKERHVVDELFVEHIEPHMEDLEQRRQTALNSANNQHKKGFMWGVVPSTAVVLLLVFSILDLGIYWAVGLGFLTMLITGYFVYAHANQSHFAYESDLREIFMAHVCSALGDLHYKRVGTFFDMGLFEEHRLIPYYEKSYLEDQLDGSYNGYRFSIVEAELSKDEEEYEEDTVCRRHIIVFKGLLIRVKYPIKQLGWVMITRKRGDFTDNISASFIGGKRVDIANEKFKSLYNVYAENPEATVHFFTQPVIELVLQLPEIIGAKDYTIVLDEGEVLISSINSTPFLEGFSVMLDPVHYRDFFGDVVRECSIAGVIIDQLDKSSNLQMIASPQNNV